MTQVIDSIPAPSDASLLRDYADARSADAFMQLVHRHAAMVYATARRITGNDADAQDVSQECFLELSRSAPRNTASLPAWLHRVASNRAINLIRSRSRRRKYETQASSESRDMSQPTWPQLEPLIDEALNGIPDEFREALVMHYLEGMSQETISKALDVNQSTVSRRIATGVEALRKAIHAKGVMLSAAALAAALPSAYSNAAPAPLVAALGKMAIGGPAAFPTASVPAARPAKPVIRLIVTVGIAITLALVGWNFLRTDGVPAGPATSASTAPSTRAENLIDGVPSLAWGKSQDTSFIGALAATLSVLNSDHDYDTLMGDSALAFRVRWWRASNGPGWDASSFVGEFAPWTDLAADSAGIKIDWEAHLDGKTDMTMFTQRVVQSIDSGTPVLGYFVNLDMSVICGYADMGNSVLLRDYSAGNTTLQAPMSQNQGMLGFITNRRDPPPRRESVLKALRRAVVDWKGWTQEQSRSSGPGTYYHGEKAYEIWMNDLASAQSFSEDDQKKLFQVQWGTFDCLNDARAAAVKYLRGSAPLFNGETAAAMLRAADQYDRVATVTSASFNQRNAFFGPWSGKGFSAWNEDVRKREIAILSQMRDIDRSAIAEVEQALNAEAAKP